MDKNVKDNIIVYDESIIVTLTEISHACAVHTEVVVEFVEYGIIEPTEHQQPWQFNATAIMRVQKALRIQHDLGLNLAGIALVIDLLDEMENLRGELALLKKA